MRPTSLHLALAMLGLAGAPLTQTDGRCVPVSERGESVARIGPIPLVDAKQFAAVYMEASFQPGMSSMVHRHDGAEAWLTLEGSQCLETPEGKLEQKAGDPGVIVPAGLPMVLTCTGTGPRRSLVLILQDATKPRSTPAMDWTPKGLCRM
jgi:quercetin dioxygenase-like cupin family protein